MQVTHFETAIKHFKVVLKSQSDQFKLVRQKVRFNLGILYDRLGEVE